MSTLADGLLAAIKASGKTREEIALEAGTSEKSLSLMATGKHDNPELQLLMRIASATNTTVGRLLGDSIAISFDDESELLRMRGWIDGKLATIDARGEPNAVIIRSTPIESRHSHIADRPREAPQRTENPFGDAARIVLRAVGNSMTGAGILADDTLYAVAPAPDATASSVGKVIACRLGDAVFVKRLVTEHRRLFLISAHPRYRAIAIDADDKTFEILGVIVGRVGTIE